MTWGEAGGRVPPLDRPLRSVIVVGGGLAGLRACEALRARGFDGGLTVVGDELHQPYDRPPLSKQYLAGTWGEERLPLRHPQQLDALEVDWRLGRPAAAVDLDRREVHLAGGERLAFDGLVLATGSVPRHLQGVARDLDGLHVLRTVGDCDGLKGIVSQPGARLVVVGAGFIGSEVASTASSLGASVTVVEALPVPLVRALGEEMGLVCASLHADAGVRLLLGKGVEEITTTAGAGDAAGRVTGVRLADGTQVDADAVLVAVGVTPATAWLEGSGLDLSDGVVCDETLHAAPGVVAAGDLARWPDRRQAAEMRIEHWENAAEQGAHAAASLLAGVGAEHYDQIPYFWSDQYGIKIQLVGHVRAGDEVRVVEGSVENRRFVACYGRAGRLVAVLSFARPRLLVRYRALLSAGATFEEALRFDPT